MKIYLTSALLLMCVIGLSQSNEPSEFASNIDTGDLRKHLYIIASPQMEGRETAMPGQKLAAAYIEQHFKSVGLLAGWQGGYQQTFPVYRDSIASLSLSIESSSLVHGKDFSISPIDAYDTVVSASELVFVGFGRSDSVRNDYDDVDTRGKIVLVVHGAPLTKVKGKKRAGPLQDYETLQEAAARNGASVLMLVSNKNAQYKQADVGQMYVSRNPDILPPIVFITDTVARMIVGTEFDMLSKAADSAPAAKVINKKIDFSLKRQQQQLESTNVIGVLEGTDKKEEAIVITAHYDHIGKRDSVINYGADDDGSGTATILELSEAFTKAASMGIKPRRSIIFMTVSGEEKGLWGSDYYSRNPTFPMDKTSANINIDMIGRVESGKRKDSLNYVYVVGDNRLSSDLRPISEAANNRTFKLTLDYKFNDPDDPQRIYYRSDHYNFAKNGVPAIFYFNGLHEDYHRPTDTPDKINYLLLQKRAQLIFHTAWDMANRETMLKRDIQ
jgi:hypothetical protein